MVAAGISAHNNRSPFLNKFFTVFFLFFSLRILCHICRYKSMGGVRSS